MLSKGCGLSSPSGKSRIPATAVPSLNSPNDLQGNRWLVELFSRHGGFDLELRARGDLDVDQHHTVEDVGLVLGQLLREALGSKKGINRAGYFIMPMDETLGIVAIDLSGRPYLVLDVPLKARYVGDLQSELLEDFFQAFANSAGANLH